MLDWRGLNGEVMFFKKLLDELEIEAQVIRGRDNKYKSAVEPFLYDHMSAPNKEQMKALLDGIWNTMLTDIATHRPSVSVETLNQAAADLKYVQINQAIEDHVVDGLLHYDEVLSRMNTRMSKEANERLPLCMLSGRSRKGKEAMK